MIKPVFIIIASLIVTVQLVAAQRFFAYNPFGVNSTTGTFDVHGRVDVGGDFSVIGLNPFNFLENEKKLQLGDFEVEGLGQSLRMKQDGQDIAMFTRANSEIAVPLQIVGQAGAELSIGSYEGSYQDLNQLGVYNLTGADAGLLISARNGAIFRGDVVVDRNLVLLGDVARGVVAWSDITNKPVGNIDKTIENYTLLSGLSLSGETFSLSGVGVGQQVSRADHTHSEYAPVNHLHEQALVNREEYCPNTTTITFPERIVASGPYNNGSYSCPTGTSGRGYIRDWVACERTLTVCVK